MRFYLPLLYSLLLSTAIAPHSWAQRGNFLSMDEFLTRAFVSDDPEVETLWLSKEQRQVSEQILRHKFSMLRVRYWYQGNRTAWVLEEVGKDLPVTIGVVVENDQILDVAVLAFRESRGGEIRFPFFTRQFQGLSLRDSGSDSGGNPDITPDRQAQAKPVLSESVDGITGATLSVRAMKKIATLALFFHQAHSNGLKKSMDPLTE